MKAKLKNIISPDVDNLEYYIPLEKDNFCLLCQLILAPEDSEGEESFDVLICTPNWLNQNHSKSDVIFGQYYLIVFEYNYITIKDKIETYIDSIEANNWIELARIIGRIGKWEFEDYQEYE
jgi:hypothetical protein